MDAAPDVARRIDCHDRQMVAVYVGADREAARGIEFELDSRLTSEAMPPPRLNDEALPDKLVGEGGDRLVGEAGLGGEFGPRDRRAALHGPKHTPAVVQRRLPAVRAYQIGVGCGLRHRPSATSMT